MQFCHTKLRIAWSNIFILVGFYNRMVWMFECCVLPSNTAALFFRDNGVHAEDGRISYTNNIR